jgi:large subunit ribosomal protein L15
MTDKTNQLKTLGNLSPAPGSNTKKKRLGRGIGSGLGKTAARGGKGQTARKGGGIRAGFEGGQTPLYRRLPKRGFHNVFEKNWNIVNLSSLNRFNDGDVVTKELLLKSRVIQDKNLPVKLLGNGTLTKKLSIKVDAASASAKSAVSKNGGSVEVGEKA